MALMEKYDAFISYSHAEDNAEIAEALHKKLEHYRIPSQIQKITGKKISQRQELLKDRNSCFLHFIGHN